MRHKVFATLIGAMLAVAAPAAADCDLYGKSVPRVPGTAASSARTGSGSRAETPALLDGGSRTVTAAMYNTRHTSARPPAMAGSPRRCRRC